MHLVNVKTVWYFIFIFILFFNLLLSFLEQERNADVTAVNNVSTKSLFELRFFRSEVSFITKFQWPLSTFFSESEPQIGCSQSVQNLYLTSVSFHDHPNEGHWNLRGGGSGAQKPNLVKLAWANLQSCHPSQQLIPFSQNNKTNKRNTWSQVTMEQNNF